MNIQDVKLKHEANGFRFFSDGNMCFFNSKIETGVLHGKYFITSEQCKPLPKRYSIRIVMDDFQIETIGNFQQFASKKRATDFLNEYLKMPAE